METSDENIFVEPVRAFVVKTEPGRKSSKRGEGHRVSAVGACRVAGVVGCVDGGMCGWGACVGGGLCG